MKITALPPPVMARLLQLETDARDAQSAAREAADGLAHARNRMRNAIEREDLERTESEIPRLVQEAEATANSYASLTQTVERCRRYVENLPDGTVLELYEPQPVEGDPAQALRETRERIATATRERDTLAKIPIPSEDLNERIEAYVADLATKAKPYVRGVGEGQQLSVKWPPKLNSHASDTTSWLSDNANPLTLAALLQPEALAKVIHDAIFREQMAVMGPVPRSIKIMDLNKEIAELQSKASDLVYVLAQSGDVRTFSNAPPNAVLGVVERDEFGAAA